MVYTVYILYSELSVKHYVGFTGNLTGRLESHYEKGHDWTSRYRPWKLIYTREFERKQEAMAYERWRKRVPEEILLNYYHTNIGFISAAADGSSSLLLATKNRSPKGGLF